MRVFKRSLLVLLLALIALAAAMAANTWRRGTRQPVAAPGPALDVGIEAASRRLAGAIRFRTVSSLENPTQSDAEFDRLHGYLAEQFPRAHAVLKKERVGQKALLFTWVGSDPAARPVALMAHQDVVPIAAGTEKAWSVDPFAGEIRDGFIWGRGTLDDKGNLFAQMEAVEALAASGFQPRRTVYFVMGDDEEVSGLRGARAIAQLLQTRGVRLEWVLDEGLLVLEGVLAGLDRPAALIGLAEKGYATFFLSLDMPPGHSSMPPRTSAIGSMAAALARLEAAPMPASIGGVASQMFETLAPEMNTLNRVMLSNLWLTRPLVQAQLEKSPSSNSMLRTTTALTIMQAGNKDNVLPGHAEAAVNFRVLPGDTLASVEAHLVRALGNDAIKVTRYEGNAEPSPVSPTEAQGYRSIAASVRHVFGDAVVAPGLMTAATDSRHFAGVSDAVYRFSPMRMKNDDLPRLHGTNERLAVANYADMIRFYRQLLLTSTGAPGRLTAAAATARPG